MSSGTHGFAEREAALRDRLRALPDSQARLSYLVSGAADTTVLEPADRCAANEIRGCSSRFWLVGGREGGVCRYRCDSESAILKAVGWQLCRLYDGLPPGEVVAWEPTVLESTGLLAGMTERRREVIRGMRERIREIALRA